MVFYVDKEKSITWVDLVNFEEVNYWYSCTSTRMDVGTNEEPWYLGGTIIRHPIQDDRGKVFCIVFYKGGRVPKLFTLKSTSAK